MLKVKGRKLESGKKSCIYVEFASVHDLASITAESAMEGNWAPSFFFFFWFGGEFSPFRDFFTKRTNVPFFPKQFTMKGN
jgi:hypothetical protein